MGFCYQLGFNSPTRVIGKEEFWALATASETYRKVREAREALERGDKATYDRRKKGLPLVVFIGTFEESVKTIENKKTGAKREVKGQWRLQKHVHLNGLVVADYDHLDECDDNANLTVNEKSQFSIREIWEEAYAKLSDADKARVTCVFVTPSGRGLKVVFKADINIGNLIDNQVDFSKKLGLPLDDSGKDATRGAFLTTREDILLINEEELFTYENSEYAKRYDEEYHEGKSGATLDVRGKMEDVRCEKSLPLSSIDFVTTQQSSKAILTLPSLLQNVPADSLQEEDNGQSSMVNDISYNGVPYSKIISAWAAQRFSKEGTSRHEASVVLARDLYIMTDRDKQKTLALLMAQPWVKEIIKERNEDVERTVNNAADYVTAQESENAKKGKSWLPKISKEMAEIVRSEEQTLSNSPLKGESSPPLREGSGVGLSDLNPPGDDVYDKLPLGVWAEELQEMAKEYPCMKELFVNVHPCKLPAVWFSSAALFGTLMTRAWYRFWYEPELIRRLNYCI